MICSEIRHLRSKTDHPYITFREKVRYAWQPIFCKGKEIKLIGAEIADVMAKDVDNS